MSDTTSVYQAYQGNTYLFGGNAPYVEEMYENYLANPGSVPDTWRDTLMHCSTYPLSTDPMPRTFRTFPWSTRSQNAPRLVAPRLWLQALTPKWAASALPFSS
jgi:2-oxoglutarate dehydrogenase E1 component (EC 1.2.4.2)